MQILVINSGSSSVKFSLFEGGREKVIILLLSGEYTGFGGITPSLLVREKGESTTRPVSAASAKDCVNLLFAEIAGGGLPSPEAIGYRVVHPGPKLDRHQRITSQVLEELIRASDFAPLHDPDAIAIIQEGFKQFPDTPQFACFDTVFHQTMPSEASTYAIPESYRLAGVRRYGFHGLSCESIVREFRSKLICLPSRLIVAHLGSGCSVTAVSDGKSLDTSMGLTPTGGIVMGTRPGDVDPDLILHLLRHSDIERVERDLNHGSGMIALSGLPNDMKAIRKEAEAGNSSALLALNVFTRSVRKCMGSFCWLMGGIDGIVFSGGIGENDSATREEVLADLSGLGVTLDPVLNEAEENGMRCISPLEARPTVYVVPAQEDLMIALHVQTMMN